MFTNNVKVYPNPTNDHLFVTFDNLDSVNIKLTDYTGKVVLKKKNYLINYESYRFKFFALGPIFAFIKLQR